MLPDAQSDRGSGYLSAGPNQPREEAGKLLSNLADRRIIFLVRQFLIGHRGQAEFR